MNLNASLRVFGVLFVVLGVAFATLVFGPQLSQSSANEPWQARGTVSPKGAIALCLLGAFGGVACAVIVLSGRSSTLGVQPAPAPAERDEAALSTDQSLPDAAPRRATSSLGAWQKVAIGLGVSVIAGSIFLPEWAPNRGYSVLALASGFAAWVVWLLRRNTLALVLLLVSVVTIITAYVPANLMWAWVLLLVPVAIIVDHASFLAMVRKSNFPMQRDHARMLDSLRGGPATPPRASSVPGESPDGQASVTSSAGSRESGAADLRIGTGKPRFTLELLKQSQSLSERYFGTDTLAIRYGFPALLLLLVGMTQAAVLFGTAQDWILYNFPMFAPIGKPIWVTAALEGPLLEPGRFGIAGAYIFIVLHLGQRSFRHDITSGAAAWCVVTLAVGPLLAIVVAKAFSFSPGPSGSGVTTSGSVAYFLAGFSPKYVAAMVGEAARRLFSTAQGSQITPGRTIQLSQIRGITPEVADRLGEEGILDVSGLAMADPFKLLRATNFDKRQIAAWIDEALLMLKLPLHWDALQKVGISGAMDLAALLDRPPADLVALPAITKMATEVKIDPLLLIQNILQLNQDTQVQIVWTLYQVLGEGDEEHRPV